MQYLELNVGNGMSMKLTLTATGTFLGGQKKSSKLCQPNSGTVTEAHHFPTQCILVV